MSNIVPFFWLLVVLLLVYEGFALKRGKGETISEQIWKLAWRFPLIPFAFGLLMGHFFWESSRCAALIGK